MDAEERYLTYVLLQQSGRENVKLNSDIHNGYTTGDERYTKTRQNTLHILNQYTKPTIQRNIESQGNYFKQKTGDVSNTKTYDRAYWKYKECYNYHQKVHQYSNCKNKKKKKDDDNENYKSSK